jgi:hypothetical protein
MTVIANSFGHIRLSRIADQLHETQGSSHIEVQADGGDELTHMHGSTVLQCKTFLGSRKYGSYCRSITQLDTVAAEVGVFLLGVACAASPASSRCV